MRPTFHLAGAPFGALLLAALIGACVPAGPDDREEDDAIDHDEALTCNLKNEKKLYREGSCAFLACCSSYGTPFPAGTAGAFSCDGQACKLAKQRAAGGKSYAPLFYCDGQAPGMDCDDTKKWLSVPGLTRSGCADEYVVCRDGTMVTDVAAKDKSHDDGGGVRWEGSEGLFDAIDLDDAGSGTVSIYKEDDPRIKTDPACGKPSSAGGTGDAAAKETASVSDPADDVACTRCGDHTCESPDEDAETCPVDCRGTCGDDTCADDESVDTCPEDCGCGDGVCDAAADEDHVSCALDCPCACAELASGTSACVDGDDERQACGDPDGAGCGGACEVVEPRSCIYLDGGEGCDAGYVDEEGAAIEDCDPDYDYVTSCDVEYACGGGAESCDDGGVPFTPDLCGGDCVCVTCG